MVEKVPPEVEAKYAKLVRLRETLAAVAQERASLEALQSELETVLEEVKGLPENARLYKMVGGILLEKSRDEVLKELTERKEDVEIRLKALKSQEEALRKDIERLTKELQELLGRGRAGGTAG
ncbi:MAG: prefoldin subunit beta [Desulfurococcales archaeon]|nr:prefoldin subunit beta [Desulfurococcales archaeon]